MSQLLSRGDSLPAISVTCPERNNLTPSPVGLAALDDSRLRPVPPISTYPPSHCQKITGSSKPQIPLPSAEHRIFSDINNPLKLFLKAKSVVENQSKVSWCGSRHTDCHVHSSGRSTGELRKLKDRKSNLTHGQGGEGSKEAIPSFSSPWGPSSCSAKRVLWKEVEAHNRQRKRMRLMRCSAEDFGGLEKGTSSSSTVCSDGSESSDGDEYFGFTTHQNVPPNGDDGFHSGDRERESKKQKSVAADTNGESYVEKQHCKIGGVSIVITTSENGETKTVLEAEPNSSFENGIEIVTKTTVSGNEVTTITTTTFIPLGLGEMKS